MSEPEEYEFTKLARFIARRNTCEHCKGTGIGWTSTVGIYGTDRTEEIHAPCVHCCDQLLSEDELAYVEKAIKVHDILDKAGVWEASTFPQCSDEEFLDRIDDTATALGD